MVIQDIQVGEISLPLARPFKTALRTVDRMESVVVRLISDTGDVGYGEAPPTAVITGDTKGSIRCAIEDFIRPALLGMEIEDLVDSTLLQPRPAMNCRRLEAGRCLSISRWRGSLSLFAVCRSRGQSVCLRQLSRRSHLCRRAIVLIRSPEQICG